MKTSSKQCQAKGGPANCTNPRCPEKLSGWRSLFASPDIKPAHASDPAPVIGSKNVRHVTAETYEIGLPIQSDAAAIENAKFELRTYADAIGYPEVEIQITEKSNRRIIWFKATKAIQGTDFNPLVYDNITWVEDLMRDQKN